MEARTEHQSIRRFNILYYITTGLGVVNFVLILIWVFAFRGGVSWRSQPSLQFNWHPILMFGGMIFLYAQAILLYRSRRYEAKKRLKLSHSFLHGLVFIFSVIGLVAVFDFHNLSEIPNMYTMHSWLGLTTVIAFCLQFVIGFVTFLFPGLAKEIRSALLPVHTAVGTAIFTLAAFTSFMGYTEKILFVMQKDYSKLPAEAYLINFTAMVTALFCVMVLYLINEKDYKRENVPEDEIALTRND